MAATEVSKVASLPSTFKRLVGDKLTADFRAATHVVTLQMDETLRNLKPNEVLVRVFYAGVQATDVNYTAGRYNSKLKAPYVTGMEGLGQVVAVGGANVRSVKLGDYVCTLNMGSFSEYQVATDRDLIPIPAPRKEILALMVSGLTASLALESAHMRSGETVLVTAAAGGAGQIAVQLAKLAGNHVIGTCSSDAKAAALKALGCDRVINYNKEDVNAVLRKEYPKGVDLVFENVGGETFQTAMRNLAVRGRLLVIGAISYYTNKEAETKSNMGDVLGDRVRTYDLLSKSQQVIGFLLPQFMANAPTHLQSLMHLLMSGKLKINTDGDQFQGVERVADAVEYLQKGGNTGKVIVTISQPPAAKL